MTATLQALRQLSELTEAQIGAALMLSGHEVESLNVSRVDALFDLRVAVESEGVPANPTDELVDAVRRLKTAETRLQTVCGAVLGVIDRVDVTRPPTTYGRSGRVG